MLPAFTLHKPCVPIYSYDGDLFIARFMFNVLTLACLSSIGKRILCALVFMYHKVLNQRKGRNRTIVDMLYGSGELYAGTMNPLDRIKGALLPASYLQ